MHFVIFKEGGADLFNHVLSPDLWSKFTYCLDSIIVLNSLLQLQHHGCPRHIHRLYQRGGSLNFFLIGNTQVR